MASRDAGSRRPKPIADLLAQVLARRGYAREEAASACDSAWRSAAGESLARLSRAGNIKRGALEVFVANSTIVQEMTFQKTALLAKLRQLLPDQPIRDLRFRVGPIE